MALPVVLDTNVLVSALLFAQGRLQWLRRAWQSGAVVPLIDRACADELLRVLHYPKFRLSAADRAELLAEILPYCESIATAASHPVLPQCRDADDVKFLKLARVGRADALVSGDADLLAVTDRFSIPILTPAAFRERVPGVVR